MSKNEAPELYPEPVAQLLYLGRPKEFGPPWRRYATLGITEADIPELTRMVTDMTLYDAPEDSLRNWAPIHAWRVLGQLRAVAAIGPLINLLRLADQNDDWASEELPQVLGLIGPAAIDPLVTRLGNRECGEWERVAIVSSFCEIGRRHPDARGECVAVLNQQLERYADNTDELNGFLIAELLDLHAVEAAPAIQQAFMSDAVDVTIVGDWDDVQKELFRSKATKKN